MPNDKSNIKWEQVKAADWEKQAAECLNCPFGELCGNVIYCMSAAGSCLKREVKTM